MFTKKALFIISLCFLASNILFAQDYSYIGAAKCKMCHNTEKSGFQYKIWSESLHAKSIATLSNAKSMEYAKKNGIKDPATDPGCLKCHATAGSATADQIETLTVAEGVSCESCHGPGSAYKTMTIMKDQKQALAKGLILPTKEVCVKCHNEKNPFFKPFDFEAAKAKIAHPTPKV
jgi:hypothetical protein